MPAASMTADVIRREWTMERIAKALNVSHKTISKDLSEFVPEVQNKPKGKGRPKGSGVKGARRGGRTAASIGARSMQYVIGPS